ncbi:MAG: penicillin-binding transpeptidase domain-containing protein [Acidobacteriota bacterium]
MAAAAGLLALPSLELVGAAQAKTGSAKKTSKPAPKANSTTKKKTTRRVASSPWKAPNYADSTSADFTEGDDPDARLAAVDALGKFNGSVVVTDADTGRILTVVGQKTAFKSGYQPCSTIKVPVALAALSESVVDRLTQIRIYGNTKVALTEALAKSNNYYFASLGEKLGFERMSYYARLYGLGEKASLNIEDEQAGILPSRTPDSGMGMMTSFGDGITLTPLEYASLIGAVANGGTLYYLQYPKNQKEAQGFQPQVKRKLDIEHIIGDLKPGMMGAVEYGTARRVGFNAEAPVYGKTGTCTDTRTPTHLGWFGSFTEVGHDRLVVVVMLTGGSAVSGGSAAGVGGAVYKNLISGNYYAHNGGGEHASPEPLAQGSTIKENAGQ